MSRQFVSSPSVAVSQSVDKTCQLDPGVYELPGDCLKSDIVLIAANAFSIKNGTDNCAVTLTFLCFL